MKERKYLNRKIFTYVFLSFFALFFSYFIYDFFTGSFTYGLLFNKWNGVGVSSVFAGGDGSRENPYRIANSYELAYFSQLVNNGVQDSDGINYSEKNYILINDIDLNNHSWHVIGNSRNNYFSGNFNGNGKTIHNLLIDDRKSDNYFGLFGYVNGASVNNLRIDGVKLNFDNFDETAYVAPLFGYYDSIVSGVVDNISITNISVDGILSSDVDIYTSMFVGYQNGSANFSNILINADSIFNEFENNHFGILTGHNSNFTVNNLLYNGDGSSLYGEFNENLGLYLNNFYQVYDNLVYSYVLDSGSYNRVELQYDIDDVLDIINSTYDDNYLCRFIFDGNNFLIFDIGSGISTTSIDNSINGYRNQFYGDGTSSFPYLINSASDLILLRNKVRDGNSYDGVSFQLTKDISLDFTSYFEPIGTVETPFQGSFDGAGHKISSFSQKIYIRQNYSLGLFGVIGGGNTRQIIKNIEFYNPSFYMGLVSISRVDYVKYGVIAGTMYNNASVSNIIVNKYTDSLYTALNFTNANTYFFGGIIGHVTNTSADDGDPGSGKRYSINNCYFNGVHQANSYAPSNIGSGIENISNGGIVGRIDNQNVWPVNCIFNGEMKYGRGSFAGPIYGSVRMGSNITIPDFYDAFWLGTGMSADFNNYYIYYRLGGNPNINFNQTADGLTYFRRNDDSSNTGYTQGLNRGEYIGGSNETINDIVTQWNSDANVNIIYNASSNDAKFSLKPKFNSVILSENNDYIYNVSVSDSNYTYDSLSYSWYLNGILQDDYSTSEFTIPSNSDPYEHFDVAVFVTDGVHYGSSIVDSYHADALDVTFARNGDSITAVLTGDFPDDSQFSYQWYSSSVFGIEKEIIDGANSTILNNTNDELVYTFQITCSNHPELNITRSTYSYNVVFVDNVSGDDSLDGSTPENAVYSLKRAYSLLPSDGTLYSNYIVIMNSYNDNSFIFGNTGSIYKKNTTITGVFGGVNYNGSLIFMAEASVGKRLTADTRFAYINLNGGLERLYLYCNGYSFIVDEQVRMINYATLNTTDNGLLKVQNTPDIHVFLGGYNPANAHLDVTNGVFIIKSGTYARIVGGNRHNGFNNGNSNTLGSIDQPYVNNINIDIVHSTTRSGVYDINTLVGGAADGTIYANTTINLYNGNIGRLINGSIGYSDTRDDTFYSNNLPPNWFYGSATANLIGGSVFEFYGGSLGRCSTTPSVSSTYFYGTTNINISGTSISSNVYGAGAGAVMGYNSHSSDPLKDGASSTVSSSHIKITGGHIYGSVYGGGYGYAVLIPKDYATEDAGVLYGNTYIEISGGRIEGSVYGGGRGADEYDFHNVAQVVGDTSVYLSGNATILGSVFGAGEGTGNYEIAKIIGNSLVTVSGNYTNDIFGGGNLGLVSGSSRVLINSGALTGSVFGGGNIGVVSGNTTVDILQDGGTINAQKVYGGGKSADGTKTYVNVYNGHVENIYGGGYSANVSESTNVSFYGGTAVNLFGGSDSSGDILRSNVNIFDGNIENVYGGNNLGGDVTSSNVIVKSDNANVDVAYLYGGGKEASTLYSSVTVLDNSNVDYIFGCGENANCSTTTINVEGSATGTSVFGGSNESGEIMLSNLSLNGSTYNSIYGGNNLGGSTTNTIITIIGGKFTNVYGGGEQAESTSSKISISDGEITNVYGGGNNAAMNSGSTINVTGGTISNLYGGGNEAIMRENSSITVDNGSIVNLYGGGNNGAINSSKVIINNGDIKNLFGGGNNAGLVTSIIEVVDGTIVSIYGGANQKGNVETSNITIGRVLPNNIQITDVYGGNNENGVTSNTNIKIDSGHISNVYGGGNMADVENTSLVIKKVNLQNIYGGGNFADVYVDTRVELLDDTVISSNYYGGGNQGKVFGSTYSYLSGANVQGSAYAGGNGANATVLGKTYITIDGTTVIGNDSSVEPEAGCVFGGGNLAVTGSEDDPNNSTNVNIVGGHIYGSVYGGANSSVIYGNTYTNLGTSAVGSNVYPGRSLVESNIQIDGGVFGGGESNSDGEQHYDFDAKSVVGTIDVCIDATGYDLNNNNFTISGSIFGSGNYSSSQGASTIKVKKLGSVDNPNIAYSFQRTDLLVIDNSYIELLGADDRTNDFSNIPYTFNWIKKLIIKNNTSLYLHNNANMLEEFYSGVDVNDNLEKASVNIDAATKSVTRNVDNRIYMLSSVGSNTNLNITTRQDASAYGKVTGMTFLGMFTKTSGNNIKLGIYDTSVNYNDNISLSDIIDRSSYVLGAHSRNQDITKDGFYTNVVPEGTRKIVVDYIEPTPKDKGFYRWLVGIDSVEYNISLNASKFSSLGTYNLSMLEFSEADVIFNVIGFDTSGLRENVNFVDSDDVPRFVPSTESTFGTLGLSMKAETREWTSRGVTKFLSADDGSYIGDDSYIVGNDEFAPSFIFYFYSPMNIGTDDDLGVVKVVIDALTPINEIEYRIQKLSINITLTSTDFSDDEHYDGSITYGKNYEVSTLRPANITNNSQFTTYYSLYIEKSLDGIYGYSSSPNYHALLTDFNLPIGTQITMIDYGRTPMTPDYYYLNITQDLYNRVQNDFNANLENNPYAVYKLSEFTRMGGLSSNDKYDELSAKQKYYSEDATVEEFIFIFDFSEVSDSVVAYDKKMLFALMNGNDIVIPVFGYNQEQMKFSLYQPNTVLEERININSNLFHDIRGKIELEATINYEKTIDNYDIIDTNYESNSMGLNIYFYDNNGDLVVSGLLDTSIIYDGKSYFADSDGVYRIKLTNKVADIKRKLYILPSSSLAAGQYKMVFVLFASKDGLHNPNDEVLNSNDEKSYIRNRYVSVSNNDSSIFVSTDDKNKVINGEKFTNLNNEDICKYNIKFNTSAENTDLRIALFRRDTSLPLTTAYNEVELSNLFSNELNDSQSTNLLYEKILYSGNLNEINIDFKISDILISGTYKLSFRLYDGDQMIDEYNTYVIVTKDIVDGS